MGTEQTGKAIVSFDPIAKAAVADEMRKHLRHINGNSLSEKDMQGLTSILKNFPELCQQMSDMAVEARDTLIDTCSPVQLIRDDMRTRAAAMKEDLDFQTSGPLERLLIDAVITAWLHYYYIE